MSPWGGHRAYEKDLPNKILSLPVMIRNPHDMAPSVLEVGARIMGSRLRKKALVNGWQRVDLSRKVDRTRLTSVSATAVLAFVLIRRS
jgi:hypothetical protein